MNTEREITISPMISVFIIIIVSILALGIAKSADQIIIQDCVKGGEG